MLIFSREFHHSDLLENNRNFTHQQFKSYSINFLIQNSFISLKTNSNNFQKLSMLIFSKLSNQKYLKSSLLKTLHTNEKSLESNEKPKPKEEERRFKDKGQGPSLPPPLCPLWVLSWGTGKS
jgi:hypothetical protein